MNNVTSDLLISSTGGLTVSYTHLQQLVIISQAGSGQEEPGQ